MFVIYRTTDTLIVDHTGRVNYSKTYKTEQAAKAARTRACKVVGIDVDLAIAELTTFTRDIEKQVERENLMTGKKFMERANTPAFCSPSSEAYFCM